MTDTNRTGIRYKVESAFGTVPSGAYTPYLYTGESLGVDTRSIQSATIRADRNIIGNPRVSFLGGGDLNAEFIYGNTDNFFQGLLLNQTPGAAATVTGTFTATGSTITGTGSDFTAIVANDLIRVKTTAGVLTGFFKVVSKASDVLTLDRAHGVGSVTEVKRGVQLTNSTSLITYTIERDYTGLTAELAHLRGFTPNTFALRMPLEGIMTTTIGFLGKDEVTYGSTPHTESGGATAEPMNTVDHVHTFAINGTAYGLLSWDTAWQNNGRARSQMGTLGAISLGTGQFAASGAFEAYYDSTIADLTDLYLSYATMPMLVATRDSAGNAYVIDYPAVNLGAGRRSSQGANQDVRGAFTFLAKMHPTQLYTARVSAIAA